MSHKVVVGPNKGLVKNSLAFLIDNDAFPMLVNAYQWRGRVKRKRGTSLLNRLRRYFDSTSSAYSSTSTITLDANGEGNLITGFSLEANASIYPTSVTITVGANNYVDTGGVGTLFLLGVDSGTINYATGAIEIASEANNAASVTMNYYPYLPVLGIESFNNPSDIFPNTLAFDTTYAYNIQTTVPFTIYDVSFYKNPASSGAYTQKSTATPTSWNGQNYSQFWTVNYQGALWATNNMPTPFVSTNIGMQFKPILTVTNITGGPPASARLTLDVSGGAHNLVQGDFLFINEVSTTTGINFQTGYITSANPQDPNFVDVAFPNATIATNGTGGIAQYLTNRSDTTKDCIRWYDGNPTDANVDAPTPQPPYGWVNFMPPLSQNIYSVADLPEEIYYLVGARIIFPFKDRLLFLGVVVQSSTGSPIYLPDTIVYSQNGTPFYTCSFTGTVTSSTTTFNPILVPSNQTATAPSYFEDQAGFGGYLTLGTDQNILTTQSNEDVLILGLDNLQGKLSYTGNDLLPFNFFIINSEYGSESTFSAVNFDVGVLAFGTRGITQTSQNECKRVDLAVPDEIFQIDVANNGPERLAAQRDYIREWVYFTYNSNSFDANYPNQTLQYNYRDGSWAVFYESYTTYGQFRTVSGYTWAQIGNRFSTWSSWNEPWDSGPSTLGQPVVLGGNQQGFVLTRDEGTNEGNSLYIQGFSGSTVTSPDHGLNTGDHIVISGCLGTISTQVNGNIFYITKLSDDTFDVVPNLDSGTYLGSGVIKRIYNPFIMTKQFPMGWELGRKTRIGPQRYLFTSTPFGQLTVLLFLSENQSSVPFSTEGAYNIGGVTPGSNVINGSLVYSNILYTCPESTNLGLSAANTNLQMIAVPISSGISTTTQNQIWHRINTSLIGDTVQVGFTLSDDQLADPNFNNQFVEIEFHGMVLDVSLSQVLA